MAAKTKLTHEMRLDCVEMRRRGYTLRQIGDKYGVTHAAVIYALQKHMPEYEATKKFSPANMRKMREKCVYPGLVKWMMETKTSPRALGIGIGIPGGSSLYRALRGAGDMNKSHIDKLLAFTGLTYEQAFGGKGE